MRVVSRGFRQYGSARLAGMLLLALLVLPAGLPPLAQDQPESTVQATEVEMVVFRLMEQDTNSVEIQAEAAQPIDNYSETPNVPYTSLQPEALQLSAAASRLRQSPKYRLLYHGGWVQDVAGRTEAVPVPLPQAAAESGLRGSLTLYRQRYLHALVDLSLAAEDGTATWHIRQGRRLRGQAIHYFDHPRFGLILAVRERSAPADPTP